MRITIPATLLLATNCLPRTQTQRLQARPVVVDLERVADSSPDRWRGMTNIFFDTIPAKLRDSIRLGATWTDVQVADVVRGDGLATIYAARFKLPGSDSIHYVVDTDGDLDLAEERRLSFRAFNALEVANVDIEVRSLSGSRRVVPYQLLLGERGYTYARIADYRVGRAWLGGREYAVELRNADGDQPFYAPNDGTVFLIDFDGDGRLAEQTAVAAQGPPSSAEEAMPPAPFFLDGRPYEVASLDSAGSRLVLRPSSAKVAAVEGFVAPELTTRQLSGERYRLSGDRGRIVLLEFWSVDCAYSERARPALDRFARTVPADHFRWTAVAREGDSTRVRLHLDSLPMDATIALRDSAAWAQWNPRGITPLFYVIDGDGVIRFRAAGASAVPTVSAKVVELLDARRLSATHR
jgi:hypothetical protein